MVGVVGQSARMDTSWLVSSPDLCLVPAELRQKFIQHETKAAHEKGALCVEAGAGVALVEAAQFDSQCLGLKMAKVSWLSVEPSGEQRLVRAVITCLDSHGFEHVMIRTDAGNLRLMQALESAGFYLADTAVKLVFRGGQSSNSATGRCRVEPFEASDLNQIQGISADIFRRSRFYADPTFGKARVDDLHRRWVRNDCEGRADLVLVCRSNERVLGYIACLFTAARPSFALPSEADIDLIAVSPQAQGQGVGKALISAALQHYRGRAERITVGTQGNNYPALGIYQQCGFQFESLTLTAHWRTRSGDAG